MLRSIIRPIELIIRPRQVNTRLDYCKELENMLESQRAIGRTGKVFQGLGATSSRNTLAAMRFLMLEYKPINTLEIGMAFGASTLAIAVCHKELGQSATKQHIAIDPFQTTVWDDTGRIALENADLVQYVDTVEAYSYIALPDLLKAGRRFDLIYIDGSHLFEDVFIDFFYSSRLLSEGGLLLFDDSSYPHIRKVLRFIDSNFPITYTKLDLSILYRKAHKLIYKLVVFLEKNQLTVYRKSGTIDRPWDTVYKDF